MKSECCNAETIEWLGRVTFSTRDRTKQEFPSTILCMMCNKEQKRKP